MALIDFAIPRAKQKGFVRVLRRSLIEEGKDHGNS